MKTTTAEETAKNLDDIIGSMDYKPTQFASDQGSEFAVTHPAIFNVLVGKLTGFPITRIFITFRKVRNGDLQT